MRKIYHLSTCDTCKRIIKELDLKNKSFDFQDIKFEQITKDQLHEMGKNVSSYEELFSKRSRKFKEYELKDKEISEEEFQDLILKEYTFLKRPVILIDDLVFIGNSKSEIQKAKEYLESIGG